MNIKSRIQNFVSSGKLNYTTILLSWKDSYYISRYTPLMIEDNIVEIFAKKIPFESFQSLSERYPIVKLKDDILFDAGEHVEHILKVKDAELVRLTSEEAKKVYTHFQNTDVLFDVMPQFVFVKTP